MSEQSKNAVLYLRCSSDRQAQKDLSIPSQRVACQKYAIEQGFTIIRVFEDAGRSARSDDRDGFLEMIEVCKANRGMVQAVIVYDTSRFARDRCDASVYKRLLKNKGIRVHYASQDIDSSSDNGFLMEGIYELFDEHYSRALGKVTLRGMIENAKRGYQNGANSPYAYRRVRVFDEKGNPKAKLEINEAEAPAVRMMFELSAKGFGMTLLQRELTKLGMFNRHGKPFERTTIAKVLQDKTYTGSTIFNRMDNKSHRLKPKEEWIVVPNTHPPIVSEELFASVQQAIAERSPELVAGRTLGCPRLFGELLRCSKCGSKLSADTAHGREKKRYMYYSCRGRRIQGDSQCAGLRVDSQALDAVLLQNIVGRIFSVNNVRRCLGQWNQIYKSEAGGSTSRKISLQRAIEKVERKRENIIKAISEGIIQPADAKLNMESLRQEQVTLENDLYSLDRPAIPHFTITDDVVNRVRETFLNEVTDVQPPAVKGFLRKFVEKIVISETEAFIHYWLPKINPSSSTDKAEGKGSILFLRPTWLRVLGTNPK